MSSPPLALSRKLENFDAFGDLFGRWGGHFQQMSRGAFTGHMSLVAGPQLRIFEVATSESIFTRGVDRVPYVSFIPITPQNVGNSWQGRRLEVGNLLLKGPDVEYFNQTRRDSCFQGLLIDAPALREHYQILTGEELPSELLSWAGLSPAADALDRLRKTMAGLLRSGVRRARWLESQEGVALQHECARCLVDALQRPTESPRRAMHFSHRSRLFRAAAAYMLAHQQEAIRAQDLCALLQVSDRLLRRAFNESCGMGPMSYFRVLRLNRVRHALTRARGSAATVEDIARAWGFHRLGAFAADYRRHFGEAPSITLGVRGWPGVQQMIRPRT